MSTEGVQVSDTHSATWCQAPVVRIQHPNFKTYTATGMINLSLKVEWLLHILSSLTLKNYTLLRVFSY